MTDDVRDKVRREIEALITKLAATELKSTIQELATLLGLRDCTCNAPEGAYHRRACPKSGWHDDPLRKVLLEFGPDPVTYYRYLSHEDLATDVTRNPAQDAPRSARMPKHIDQQVLTIVGDRQHGKSHLLELAAIDEAANGREQVWWECEGPREARERFHSTTRTVARGNYAPVDVIDRSGKLELRFTGGGRIRVFSSGRPVELVPTVHLLDGVTAQPYSGVKRVIRTVLR